MSSISEILRPLERQLTNTLDPIGCCLVTEGQIHEGETVEELQNSLRERSSQSALHDIPEDATAAAPPGALPSPAVPRLTSTRHAAQLLGAGAAHAAPQPFLAALQAAAAEPLCLGGDGCTCADGACDAGSCAVCAAALMMLSQETITTPLTQAAAATAAASEARAAAAAAAAATPATDMKVVLCAATADADAGVGAAAAGMACTCPPFAVQAACGKRQSMEDSYALCPNIADLPAVSAGNSQPLADKLPKRVALQFETICSSEDSFTACCMRPRPRVNELPPAPPPPPALPEPPASARGDGGGADAEDVCERLHFFGVYDGHGGAEASQHCAVRLHRHLSEQVAAIAGRLEAAVDDARRRWLAAQPPPPPPLPPAAAAATRLPGRRAGVVGAAAAEVAEVSRLRTASWQGEVEFVPVYGRASPPEAAACGPLTGGAGCSDARHAAGSTGDGTDFDSGSGEFESTVDGSDGFVSSASSSLVTSDSSDDGDDGGASTGDDAELQRADLSTRNIAYSLVERALHEAFVKTDEEFSTDGTAGLVGSTAVVALVGQRRVWVANCGDSRAVLSRAGLAIQVTDDHKPEREDEAERVERAGGQVLYWNGHRVMGVLAMSRAIGDHSLRPYVIPEPEITAFSRQPNDQVLLLASDGLWDVMTNQEATDLALRSMRRARDKGASRRRAARVAATVLTKAGLDRGSRDNITVVVIDLGAAPGEESCGEPACGAQVITGGACGKPAAARPARPAPARGGAMPREGGELRERRRSGGEGGSGGLCFGGDANGGSAAAAGGEAVTAHQHGRDSSSTTGAGAGGQPSPFNAHVSNPFASASSDPHAHN